MISSRISSFSLAGGLLLTLACGGGGGGYGGGGYNSPPPPPPSYIRASALGGADEVPANASTATATGQVTVEPTTLALSGAVVTTGIQGTAAYIREGAAGAAGPVIFTLTGGSGGIWKVPASTVLTSAQYASLQAGHYYFDVSSAAFPDGEIRGQIELVTRFASLNGSQETPASGSSATGTGILSVNAATGATYGVILAQGITGNAAHVHDGATGTILLPFIDGGGGTWIMPSNSALTSAQVATFQAGGLYGNVHSAAFPNGEIRGQFNLSSTLIRSTTLSGANEVPANPSAATGTGTFALDPKTLALRGGVATSGITAIAAHIHTGVAGVPGVVIVPLLQGADGSWVVPAGTFLTPAQFDAFRAGGLYVNVHSAAYQDGEIRGQIPADAPSSTGGGGGGGTGGGGY